MPTRSLCQLRRIRTMMMMRREAKEDPGPCLPSAPCSSCPPPTRELGWLHMHAHKLVYTVWRGGRIKVFVCSQVSAGVSLHLHSALFRDVHPAGHRHEQYRPGRRRPCLAWIPSQQCKNVDMHSFVAWNTLCVHDITTMLFVFYLTCLLICTSPVVCGRFKGIADIINSRVTLVWEEGLNPCSLMSVIS